MSSILLISTCKEKLHDYEFVKPIEDILRGARVEFFTRHYKKVSKGDWNNATKIIICGTSLHDNEFVKNINYFLGIRGTKKPVLGICAGMQIIGMVFDLELQVARLEIKNNFNYLLKRKTEIGFYKEDFSREFLGLSGKQEVYHLHNNFIDFKRLKEFDIFAEGDGVVQAVKHKTKPIYGVLFHPEVRQKDLIKRFVELA